MNTSTTMENPENQTAMPGSPEVTKDVDADTTIHPFNTSNVTVIEKSLEVNVEIPPQKTVIISCDGSDSGVEINETQKSTDNLQDLDQVRSCDSSISYCSNYDEAFNILVRRNSSLLENCRATNGTNGTSENGSESSSVSSKTSKSRVTVRRKPADTPRRSTPVAPPVAVRDRSKTKPPMTPRPQTNQRIRPTNLVNNNSNNSNNNSKRKTEAKKETKLVRTPSTSRTPLSTPTDGRWPSINSRPAPLMSKSISKNSFESTNKKTSNMSTSCTSTLDTKTIEKYATLPRRRKEKSDDSLDKTRKTSPRENSINRLSMPKKNSASTDTKRKGKVKIYTENCNQTALTMDDITKILEGKTIRVITPDKKEFVEKNIQADVRHTDEFEKLELKLKELTEKYETLRENSLVKDEKFKNLEEKYRGEVLEKQGLAEELKRNTERVLTILGEQDSNNSDSLMVLETRFQNVSQIILNQEREISELNSLCRSLQIALDQTRSHQAILASQHKELEIESMELQEFMQSEKAALADALRESETEIEKLKTALKNKEHELHEKQEESTHLVRLSEKRRQENLGLQAKLGAMEAKCRELLVQQGSSVSGAAVALSALTNRLESLTNELITSYNISEEELDDVIVYHNEAYNNNDTSTARKPQNTIPTSKSSSFITAVINAIKNNAPFSRDVSRNNLQTATSSSEMLDSETEPCLMMEHVLEDVVLPDGHTHNLISTNHRLTHSESLKDLSQAIINREKSEQSASLNTSFSGESFDVSMSLLDQVIDVDNSITRLLKVIRIIQMESEEYVSELEDHRECLDEQIDKQKETNVFVVKQLKDWEFLGAKLKNQVADLEQKLAEKDDELENLKVELTKEREQIERQNQDVCELSTALSKIELEAKVKQEEVNEAIERWEKAGETPSSEILARIVNASEKCRGYLKNDEDLDEDKTVLIEKVKEAVTEVKKQYEAIDKALEVLHNVQSVVQQCPQLAKLQSDLEELSFESASKMPILPVSSTTDLNVNASLLRVIKNLEINTTA